MPKRIKFLNYFVWHFPNLQILLLNYLLGYTGRDTPFPGFLGENEIDHKKETSIVYANGPGAKENSYELDSDGQCSRVDPGNHNVTEMTYQYPALVHKKEETHASDDVGLR